MDPPRKRLRNFHGSLHRPSVEDDMGVADAGWKLPWKSSKKVFVDVFVEVSIEMKSKLPKRRT